ncbi:hypothetical protein J3T99_05670 [Acetobacteraceae bacterium B3987]|nr:hypothetical protein [Acetobacteraceae bacterium B3987]
MNPPPQPSRASLKGSLNDKEKKSGEEPFNGDFSRAAEHFRLQESQEEHRHAQLMREKDLGWLGKFLGGRESAPLTLALLTIAAAFVFVAISLFLEGMAPSGSAVWDRIVDGAFSLISTSLAYAFGRGSRG